MIMMIMMMILMSMLSISMMANYELNDKYQNDSTIHLLFGIDPVTDMDDNTREDDDNDNANHDNAPAE